MDSLVRRIQLRTHLLEMMTFNTHESFRIPFRATCVYRWPIPAYQRLRDSPSRSRPSFGGCVMSSNDTEYYRWRANEEREKALKSERQNVAAIHEELAQQYQALVDQAELRPTLRIVIPDQESCSASA